MSTQLLPACHQNESELLKSQLQPEHEFLSLQEYQGGKIKVTRATTSPPYCLYLYFLVQLLFSLEVLIPPVLFGFDWACFFFWFCFVLFCFVLLSLLSFCFLHSFIGGNEPSSGRNSPVPYRPDSRPLTPTYAQAPKHFHVPGRSWHCVCLAVLSQCRM